MSLPIFARKQAMSRQTVDLLFDDLTKQPIADGEGKTIRFMYAGITYEIDLTNENERVFAAAMAPYIAVARRADLQTQLQDLREELKSPRARALVRAWAAANGLSVAPRGRIPSEVLEAYASRAK
ncbi:Lsr2 family protein [Leifsonia sp. PS1209]|uniref:histone-like nucleoid-structuring protein Lsr2 n=1 Tax=Leifsonia sp. PS1209 TaxID=2724914 RepID=UPI001442AAFC|nr:Lsr2 family protein [Leifsonia sp. PS1209]QIZ97591.1 Lsr2 family protein [Leifsonia sp. PS1209]